MDSVIKIEKLKFKYRQNQVLDDLTFSIKPGQVTAILGANGCGKTTLLKLIMGLLRTREGTIHIADREIKQYSPHKLARKIAYVPQAHAAVFPYSVREIVAMGRETMRGCFRREGPASRDYVDAALDRLGINCLSDRIYSELSGGERQMVLIARALAQETSVIVMDEPVSGLDFGNQIKLLEIVRELADSGLAIIKSTHFPEHALMCADRAILLHKGKLLADGSPEEAVNSSNLMKIYNIGVNVLTLPDGSLYCRPELRKNAFTL